MIIKKEVKCYNERKYGKPWGAIVTFEGAQIHYEYNGHYIYNDSVGDAGMVRIHAKKDDIVAFSQKNNRGRSNKEEFFVVGGDGELKSISKLDAQEFFLNKVDAYFANRVPCYYDDGAQDKRIREMN